MRRNAFPLFTFCALALLLSGCGTFGAKKNADTQSDAAMEEAYAPLPEEQPQTRPEPYADYSAPEESDRTSRTLASYQEDQPEPRYHVVAKRDTLYALARAYYGDQRRWKDIYEANRAELSDPDLIKVGQRLLIP